MCVIVIENDGRNKLNIDLQKIREYPVKIYLMEGRHKEKREVVIKEYKLPELAEIYCITKYMMRKRLKKIKKEIGKRTGYYFGYDQVEKIFELIPLPSNVDLIRRTD